MFNIHLDFTQIESSLLSLPWITVEWCPRKRPGNKTHKKFVPQDFFENSCYFHQNKTICTMKFVDPWYQQPEDCKQLDSIFIWHHFNFPVPVRLSFRQNDYTATSVYNPAAHSLRHSTECLRSENSVGEWLQPSLFQVNGGREFRWLI